MYHAYDIITIYGYIVHDDDDCTCHPQWPPVSATNPSQAKQMGLRPEPWNGLENVLISEIIAPVATEINQPVDKGCNLLVQLVIA